MEWVIGGIILLLILGAIFKPSRCDICNVNFKRKYYTWEIEGKKQHLCPNCSSKMDRRISSKKFKDRFG
ncbi:hypothetical protein Ppb6_01000 [Photorhabdus australis subsp. thailandensis]|uniref:Uncharacterized protein n=1 Tax=Photorhabdus australis subsp. thailandensis TaxID=2805096 RepID=A0A1C0U776_9GAMM|nr:hypothetical protein [Photorhabdus australis]OCQ53774.1 hypothetical protein Ppb6_01000 [Photorhabdus australis subsp. thailandensis]